MEHIHDNYFIVNETEHGDYELNTSAALRKCGIEAKPFDKEAFLKGEKELYPDHFDDKGDLTTIGKKL